jgi:hypothetical protein
MSSQAVVTIGLQELTKEEIDRRIGDVASCLMGVTPGVEADQDALRPRWITAAELVERMRPFLVMN